jgi:hypothetical protein
LPKYNNPGDCGTNGGSWSTSSWGIGAPYVFYFLFHYLFNCSQVYRKYTLNGFLYLFHFLHSECLPTMYSRDNHHGNTATGVMWNYNWTIPNNPSDACVVRLRYASCLTLVCGSFCFRYNVSSADFPAWGSDMVTAANNNDNSPIQEDATSDWVGTWYHIFVGLQFDSRLFQGLVMT